MCTKHTRYMCNCIQIMCWIACELASFAGKKIISRYDWNRAFTRREKAVKGLKVIGCTTKGGHYSVSTLRAATVGEREAKFCSVKVVSHVKEWWPNLGGVSILISGILYNIVLQRIWNKTNFFHKFYFSLSCQITVMFILWQKCYLP